VIELINDPKRLSIMRNAARERALSRSWSAVFDGVYDAYNDALDKKKMSGDRIHTD